MTLVLRFGGWFQCRLATDPDPYDDPAGVTGKAIALAHEPPLDRLIRFQEPSAPRLEAPAVGVRVLAVERDRVPVERHPFAGARVDLLDGARFEGRNGLVADDGEEPIVPFVLRIAGDGVALQREDPPGALGGDPDPEVVRHRFGGGVQPGGEDEILAAIGEATPFDPAAWLARRRQALELAHDAETDPARRAGLEMRLAKLTDLLLMRVRYEFAIGQGGGSGSIEGEDRLPERVDAEAPWPLAFWMGAWDVDGLVGYVLGRLELPLL